MSGLRDRIADYLTFGVAYVWVVDPRKRRAWIHTAAGASEARDGLLRTTSPEIIVPLKEIFAELRR